MKKNYTNKSFVKVANWFKSLKNSSSSHGVKTNCQLPKRLGLNTYYLLSSYKSLLTNARMYIDHFAKYLECPKFFFFVCRLHFWNDGFERLCNSRECNFGSSTERL